MISSLSQLLGLVCVSGTISFVALFTAAFFRLWLDRMAADAANSADD